MPSSSLSYCRAIVMAERRSAWAVLLFLSRGGGSNQTAPQVCSRPHPRLYLIRMLVLVGSPCSISDFFSAKIFLMVLASWDTSASQTHPSSVGQQHTQSSQGGTHLKHLGAGLVVSLGIFNQQFHVFSHGANAAVVAQLDGRHLSESFLTRMEKKTMIFG